MEHRQKSLEETILAVIEEDRRRRRRTMLRGGGAVLAVLLLAGTGLWASTALAAGQNCASGLICFSAGDPAVADNVNQNFSTIKSWIEGKVGDVDDPANRDRIPVQDVGGTAGNLSGGLVLDEGTPQMRLDGNEIDADGKLFLNRASQRLVEAGGGMSVLGGLDVGGDFTLDGRIDTTDVGGAAGAVTGGLVIREGSTVLRVDGNELDADRTLLLNAVSQQPVETGGDLTVKGDLKSWPAGNYCILQKGGSCPSGFSGGHMFLDVNSSYTAWSGELGDVSFNNFKDVTINLCCK